MARADIVKWFFYVFAPVHTYRGSDCSASSSELVFSVLISAILVASWC